MPRAYMLDTNIFNHALQYAVDPAALAKRGPLIATHVQFQELEATRNTAKRSQLLDLFKLIGPTRMPTENSQFEITPWDEGKWPTDDGFFELMLMELNRLNRSRSNNREDILIAETALRNGWALVTDDADLRRVIRTFNGESLTLAEFLAS
jgi:hypothetical protein